MSRTRVYYDGQIETGRHVELKGDAARHLGRVLRLRAGDSLTLFDGKGLEFDAKIQDVGKATVRVMAGDRLERDVTSPLGIHLLQGVSRGERMDFVVQKATELGVARITPVMTEYSVVKLSDERARKRLAHWRGVAISACEQCGRNRMPDIDPPTGLREWLGQNLEKPDPRIVLRPGAPGTLRSLPDDAQAIVVLIGPEGGLSDAEFELVGSAGFEAIGFGPRILRTETAALAIVAALQTLYGDLA